jgi:hypothetical protein
MEDVRFAETETDGIAISTRVAPARFFPLVFDLGQSFTKVSIIKS